MSPTQKRETPAEVTARGRLSEFLKNRRMSREDLEDMYGEVWDQEELDHEFETVCEIPPCRRVTGRFSGRTGTVLYQPDPRFYFSFAPDESPDEAE